MKRLSSFFISVFILLSINLYGQDIYIGKIIYMPNPCQTEPCLPGMVFGLETTSNNYVLTINSNWIWSNNKLIVYDIEYLIDDEVEITGITTSKQDINSKEYIELEIDAIKKWTTNIKSLFFDSEKIYYNPLTQEITIEKPIQPQFLTLELYDMLGKMILRKTDVGNTVSIANLHQGVYVYRLLEDNRVVGVGKVVR